MYYDCVPHNCSAVGLSHAIVLAAFIPAIPTSAITGAHTLTLLSFIEESNLLFRVTDWYWRGLAPET
jgi:hypothetical protein